MLFNLATFEKWISTLLVYYFIIFFMLMSTSSSFFIDLVPRLDTNESYLHLYPLFWTHFWFLAPFYFLTSLYFSKSWILNLILSIFYITYLTELNDFNLSNYLYLIPELTTFNSLLTNNLNKYHPFLFFITTHLYFLLIYVCLLLGWTSQRFIFITKIKLIYQLNKFFTSNAIFSLSLGGIWAFQEASWGGFWNWDSSETFGLIFLIIAFYILHTYLTINKLIQFVYNMLYTSWWVILIYCFIQLNFDLISHNFGIKFLHLFSNSFFYKEIIIFSVLLLNYLWYFNWCDKKQIMLVTFLKKNNQHNTYFFFWWQLIWLSVGIFLFYSFTPLINYTTFLLLQFNWFNTSISLNITNLLLYFYLIYWFTLKIKPHVLTQIVWSLLMPNFLYNFVLGVFLRYRLYIVIHVFLIWTLIFNFLTYNTTSLTWLLSPLTNIKLIDNVYFVSSSIFFTCDHVFIENYKQYNSTTSESSWWITSFVSNTSTINPFLLLISSEGCVSVYQITTGFIASTVLITTPYTFLLVLSVINFIIFINIWYNLKSFRL